ncbi:cysteine peptidase family C39 domain-containing protein [Scytonema sp. PRP1]|uniref:cysteine peptidase family C39 domain-containing protein n=1 Tax=Scytonema sp. PRP1 TaxID=3120513 RepID=UPI002FCF344A
MNSFSSLRAQTEQNSTSKQHCPTASPSILNFLRLVVEDTSLVSDFSKVWVVREFQLGDDLTTYNPGRKSQDTNNVLYLVCQGRVRLLGFDATVGKEVSTQLLLAQQTFGADHLFCNQPLPYRAIAASDGCVAQVTISNLVSWLERIPNLQNHLQQVVFERQALIFFKTCTELSWQKSYALRQFLPYLVQKKIDAGSSLSEVTPPKEGRFWLMSGKICSQEAEKPPRLGNSWGYPQTLLPAWSAETDLQVYQLSVEHWESFGAIASGSGTFAIAPELSPTQCEEEDKGTDQFKIQNSKYVLRTRYANKIEKSLPTVPPALNPELESSKAAETIADIHFSQEGIPPHPSITRLWRGIPFIQQQSSSDCGAACLAMISRYWGKRFSLNTLRNLAQTDRLGASLSDLADAAQNLGYQALPVRGSLNALELQKRPWIAHWQGIHYVVVWQVKGDRVLICDPAIGKRSLTRQEFEENWTQYALCLSPTERFKAFKDEKISLLGFWQLFWQHRILLGQIILASVLLQVFGLATPIYAQVLLDQVMPQKSLATLNVLAVSFFIFGIWRIALTTVRQYLLNYFSNRIDTTLMGSFMSHTLRLPLHFFASRQVEDIITRVQENRKIQLFLTRQTITTVLDGAIALVYLGLMAYYNLQLTLLVLVLLVPIVVLTLGVSPSLKTASRETYKKSAAQNSSLVEIVTGISTIKTAGSEQGLRWYWEQRFTDMLEARFHSQKLAHKFQLTKSVINHFRNTAVLWYGTTLVIHQQMSVGQFVAFHMLIGSAINPVLGLLGLWDEFQEVLISMERLNDVLTAQPEENPQKPLLVLPRIRGDVCIENVTFRFSQYEQRNTLQNVSFRIKAGQTIGIVGSSGSEKSTLVNLLAGLYRPNTGRILIDGHDIAHISPQSLRSQLGVVPQECFLFSGTILENITLYSSEYTLEQVIAAAQLAEAHTFIQSLPLEYNTRIGKGGITLSSGQRQRIAIARVLLRNPRILILDEATSSLDTESEPQFLENIARFSRVSVAAPSEARTTFIIAHHLSTVRHADCILVLDQGSLVEHGTHQELMTIGGLYNYLIQQQLHL